MMAIPRQLNKIPCCLCGTMIVPNPANQCGACLAQEINLRELVQRAPGGGDILVHQCRQCRRFEQTERQYINAEMESPELMGICLKKIPALAANAAPKLHIVDANWIWTEPNSMRLVVLLTIRTEVHNVPVQQRVKVKLVIKFKQCKECNREYTNRTWHAIVQLRQKRNDDAPRKGLVVLEMALARNQQIRKPVLNIDACKQGFDFYFLSLADAQKFASYLSRVAPMQIKTTKKLVSTDSHNNTANMKYTVACDMVPLCRDDLVMVHKSGKGNLTGRLCLVTKMSSVVHLVDASPKRSPTMDGVVGELSPETYYRSGADKTYKVLSSSRRMTRFVVLDVELCDGGDSYRNNDITTDQDTPVNHETDGERALYRGPASGVAKHALADVMVARESDFGVNDQTFRCVTHLGNLLQVGDTVLGYDLESSVLSGGAEWEIGRCFNSSFVMPDVVLVKKLHGVENSSSSNNNSGGSYDDHATSGEQTNGRGNNVDERKKKGRTKRRERRRKREDKKMRALEEAAERMGFLEQDGFNETQFQQELEQDPDLAEDVRLAEMELGTVKEETPTDEQQEGDDSDDGDEEQDKQETTSEEVADANSGADVEEGSEDALNPNNDPQ